MVLFEKDFYKFISDFREYKIRVYETGCEYLNEILSKFMRNNVNNRDFYSVESLAEIFQDFFAENEHYANQILDAGYSRVNEKEELARDIPLIFKERENIDKCCLQFYLSAIMHIVDICMFECKDLKSFTDKNLKKLPIVLFILQKEK